jgi:hypothetical protein
VKVKLFLRNYFAQEDPVYGKAILLQLLVLVSRTDKQQQNFI